MREVLPWLLAAPLLVRPYVEMMMILEQTCKEDLLLNIVLGNEGLTVTIHSIRNPTADKQTSKVHLKFSSHRFHAVSIYIPPKTS